MPQLLVRHRCPASGKTLDWEDSMQNTPYLQKDDSLCFAEAQDLRDLLDRLRRWLRRHCIERSW